MTILHSGKDLETADAIGWMTRIVKQGHEGAGKPVCGVVARQSGLVILPHQRILLCPLFAVIFHVYISVMVSRRNWYQPTTK